MKLKVAASQSRHDIIVIGASHGGVNALRELIAHLPQDLAAAVFIVLHTTPTAKTILHSILEKEGRLPAVLPQNGERFRSGTCYVARPNHHLLVKRDHIAITFGPRENRVRPSIDALFRSAAAAHASRVIGVLLTGYLYDGVLGLSAVKRCGGITIVQDPTEAEASELPATAIRRVEVDHILTLRSIAEKLSELVKQPAARPIKIPEDIMEEVRASEHTVPDLDHMRKIGDLTPYTCPECGGVLWKTRIEPIRFVCHTGHAFSNEAFLEGQAEVIENSLWSAIRYIQERIAVLTQMAESERNRGAGKTAAHYADRAAEMKEHVVNIRKFIVSGVLNSLMQPETEKASGGT